MSEPDVDRPIGTLNWEFMAVMWDPFSIHGELNPEQDGRCLAAIAPVASGLALRVGATETWDC
jgi:hypothetical protein